MSPRSTTLPLCFWNFGSNSAWHVSTTINRFWNLLGCTFLRSHFRVASPSFSFARHGWCPGSFKIPPCIFGSLFVILVIRINKVNSSQSSSIVFVLLFCPFLFFSILSGFPSLGPYFWPYTIWSGVVFGCLSISHRTTKIPWDVSFGGDELRETFPRIWQASVPIDIPIIDTFLVHNVQISERRPCCINEIQWNRECLFLRHI